MKKKLLMLPLMILIIVGCSNNNKEYEKIMEEYSTKYYELHMNKNANVFEITIASLKAVSNEDNYDMSKLSKCDDDSSIKLYVDEESRDIIKYEHNLKCK